MKTRSILAGGIYHVYNRGTLQMPIFNDNRDYLRFLTKLFEYKQKYAVIVSAYCLMPNHFHLLLKEPMGRLNENISNISMMMKVLLNAYGKYYCAKYKHSGNVFQGRFKSKRINSDGYYLQVLDYILENPVRKKLVKKREHWPFAGCLATTLVEQQALSICAPSV
jgi:putative transposase